MDRLVSMQAFTRVVDVGSFARAAESLDLPKATLTRLIQNLETHLGVKLLHRTTRRISVTTDGAAYYERCVRILADVGMPSSRSRATTTRRAARCAWTPRPASPGWC